jgi:hypothetical protein
MLEIVGVDVVKCGGRQHRSAAVAERNGPAGVEEQGTFTVGSSRNLGGPVVSVNEAGMGTPVNNPGPAAVASCGCRNEAQGAWRYREAKETKRRGRDGRKAECFVVPRKRGNQPEGPRGGKRPYCESSGRVAHRVHRLGDF